jgi:hypothetical protein
MVLIERSVETPKSSEHSCKESGRADLREAFVGVSTSKRPQINNAQYQRIPSKVFEDVRRVKKLSIMS